jgi:hypothetical protein
MYSGKIARWFSRLEIARVQIQCARDTRLLTWSCIVVIQHTFNKILDHFSGFNVLVQY